MLSAAGAPGWGLTSPVVGERTCSHTHVGVRRVMQEYSVGDTELMSWLGRAWSWGYRGSSSSTHLQRDGPGALLGEAVGKGTMCGRWGDTGHFLALALPHLFWKVLNVQKKKF